jgi:hypothetical protein
LKHRAVRPPEHWLSAWIKQGRNGSKFMSIALTPKDQQQARKTEVASRCNDDMEDAIPF